MNEELDVAQAAVRAYIDATAYGSYVSDEVCRELAQAVVDAVERYRETK